MSKKRKFRFIVAMKNTIIVMLCLVFSWMIINNLLSAYEQRKYLPLGKLAEVNNKNIHVYSKGEGKNTIVLLSGLGTAAPVLDFEPLINELSKNNRVVVVEPFGYGWSDITNNQRTVENIVEEIRLALQKSDIKGPYILMPHSISGIYSIYYANKHPKEIKAVIGIDPTLPRMVEYFNESAPTMPNLMGTLAPTGIVRLAVIAASNNFLPIADKGTYTDENLKFTKLISSWKGYNKNIVAEANEISNNIDKTINMDFPTEIPVMIFTTKKDKTTEDGKSNITFYGTYLSNLTTSKLVALEGHHYLHWTRYKEISELANEFINN